MNGFTTTMREYAMVAHLHVGIGHVRTKRLPGGSAANANRGTERETYFH